MIVTITRLVRPDVSTSFNPPHWEEQTGELSDDGLTFTLRDYWPDLPTKYRTLAEPHRKERYRQRLEWCKLNSIGVFSQTTIVRETERD